MPGQRSSGDPMQLVAAMAGGELSAAALVTDQIVRLHEVHSETNCVAAWNESAEAEAVTLDARLAAEGPVGPLHGVPVTVKDWIDVEGMACTGGETEHRDRMPTRDASVVARLRAAGAIIIAKTAVQVESELFGRVLHPFDPERSPGGSSSGEAAAVGAGGSILGIGSDSGGSIRVPAAWCGVAALKPSAGRVPTTGHFPRVGERMDGRTQIGPIARSVGTLRAVLEIVAGPDGVDGGIPPVPLGDPDSVDVRGLRVGWSTGDTSHAPDPAIRAAVEHAVNVLTAEGANAVGEIPQHLDEALDITRRYWQRAVGRLDGWDVEAHLANWDRYRTRMLRAHRDVDIVVMPVTQTTAPIHRPMGEIHYLFTLPASLTGAPVVVVPIGWDRGLPIAVQVVAQPWCDHIALRAAAVVETAG